MKTFFFLNALFEYVLFVFPPFTVWCFRAAQLISSGRFRLLSDCFLSLSLALHTPGSPHILLLHTHTRTLFALRSFSTIATIISHLLAITSLIAHYFCIVVVVVVATNRLCARLYIRYCCCSTRFSRHLINSFVSPALHCISIFSSEFSEKSCTQVEATESCSGGGGGVVVLAMVMEWKTAVSFHD